MITVSMLSGTRSKLYFRGQTASNELAFHFSGPKYVVERMADIILSQRLYKLEGGIEPLHTADFYSIEFRFQWSQHMEKPVRDIPGIAEDLTKAYIAKFRG